MIHVITEGVLGLQHLQSLYSKQKGRPGIVEAF